MQVSDVSPADLDDVLALNEACVPHLNSLNMEALRWFAANAPYFRLVRTAGRLAGFLIGLGPGLDYASPNYRFFCDRYASFGYVDRVAVAADARRLGVGSRLYEDYEDTLRGNAPVLTCEVNLRPPARASMAYHERHGFACVATQETEGGRKEVALMEKWL
jgi:predicted GNAT superfamily acetyltransferase